MLDVFLGNDAVAGNGAQALLGGLSDRPLLSPAFVASIAKDAFSLRGLYSDYLRAVARDYSRNVARIWAD